MHIFAMAEYKLHQGNILDKHFVASYSTSTLWLSYFHSRLFVYFPLNCSTFLAHWGPLIRQLLEYRARKQLAVV